MRMPQLSLMLEARGEICLACCFGASSGMQVLNESSGSATGRNHVAGSISLMGLSLSTLLFDDGVGRTPSAAGINRSAICRGDVIWLLRSRGPHVSVKAVCFVVLAWLFEFGCAAADAAAIVVSSAMQAESSRAQFKLSTPVPSTSRVRPSRPAVASTYSAVGRSKTILAVRYACRPSSVGWWSHDAQFRSCRTSWSRVPETAI